ncbi:MAG: shikimate dehydrogenase family protein [Candidatus Dormibacteria bacterium]
MPLVAPKWLQLGLIGSGLRHSPSPAMQRAALRARDIQGDYTVLDVSPEELPGLLRQLRSGELGGCNVTVPYKAALAAACDRLEGDAAICQAVNTLLARDGELIGENTDARGFELALSYLRLRPEPGGHALVLGAGGGAAACVLALCRMRVEEVVVVARRPEQAEDLCLRVSPDSARPLAWQDTEAIAGAAREADVLVNAASTGVGGIPLTLDLLPTRCVVADLRYRPRPVDVVAAAQARGLRATDGVEMLLFQGMLSFQRWTGADPPWHAARAALEEALAG